MRMWIYRAGMLIALAGTLAGCGGGGDDYKLNPVPPPAPQPGGPTLDGGAVQRSTGSRGLPPPPGVPPAR